MGFIHRSTATYFQEFLFPHPHSFIPLQHWRSGGTIRVNQWMEYQGFNHWRGHTTAATKSASFRFPHFHYFLYYRCCRMKYYVAASIIAATADTSHLGMIP